MAKRKRKCQQVVHWIVANAAERGIKTAAAPAVDPNTTQLAARVRRQIRPAACERARRNPKLLLARRLNGRQALLAACETEANAARVLAGAAPSAEQRERDTSGQRNSQLASEALHTGSQTAVRILVAAHTRLLTHLAPPETPQASPVMPNSTVQRQALSTVSLHGKGSVTPPSYVCEASKK
jgi:hypothetical protein